MADTVLERTRRIEIPPERFLARSGQIFRAFREQDSGNLCFGVACAGERRFVKTAGLAATWARIAHLERAIVLARRYAHPALPRLRNVIASPSGPVLVYDWAPGELLRGPAGARFRTLPFARIAAALDVIYDVHTLLASDGVVASDFYDGCLLYDFGTHRLHLCDLDHYTDGPFTLEAKRNLGSTRFMAPEEFRRGATLDQRTNVFTLGRTAFVLAGDGTTDRARFRGSDALYGVAVRACRPERGDRFPDVAAFVAAWRAARDQPS